MRPQCSGNAAAGTSAHGIAAKFAERRIAALGEVLVRAEAEAAAERGRRQAAVGEAKALKTVNYCLLHMLYSVAETEDNLLSATRWSDRHNEMT